MEGDLHGTSKAGDKHHSQRLGVRGFELPYYRTTVDFFKNYRTTAIKFWYK